MEPFGDNSENTAAHELDPSQVVPGSLAQDELASLLLEPGDHLVYSDGEEMRVHRIVGEWTHIGRSTSSEIRFEDATVSRRHALVVRRPDGLKVIDDRSLNGVYVGGKRVEIHPLRSGDCIQVGRHSIHFVSVAVKTPLVQALPAEALQV